MGASTVRKLAASASSDWYYLQEVINRLYGQTFEVATLVGANCVPSDLEHFLESDIGLFILEDDRINEASQILARLKGEANDEA